MPKVQDQQKNLYDANWIRSGRLGLAILAFILGGIFIGSFINTLIHIGVLLIGWVLGAIMGYGIFWFLDERYPATGKCPYCSTKVARDIGHRDWSICPKCKKRLEWHL